MRLKMKTHYEAFAQENSVILAGIAKSRFFFYLWPASEGSHRPSLHDIMKKEFGDAVPPEETVELLKKLGEIIRMRHLITIYEVDREAGTPIVDIDEAFLTTLLKGWCIYLMFWASRSILNLMFKKPDKIEIINWVILIPCSKTRSTLWYDTHHTQVVVGQLPHGAYCIKLLPEKNSVYFNRIFFLPMAKPMVKSCLPEFFLSGISCMQ